MQLVKRFLLLITSVIFLISCKNNYFEITYRSGEDNVPSYKIYNEENPLEYKYAIEISITSYNQKKIINCNDFIYKLDNSRIAPIGFAKMWIHYNEQYFYNGIKKEEVIDNTTCTAYLLFEKRINGGQLLFHSFILNIDKTRKFV